MVEQFIHPDIQKQSIKDKGTGFIAKRSIPARTVIIRELPAFKIPDDEKIVCDMLQLLYYIFTCPDRDKWKAFKKLHPESLDSYKIDWGEIHPRLDKLAKVYPEKARYLKNLDRDKLRLACAKYCCNAFNFNGGKPAIFFEGTRLNHSCLPNVVFGKVGDYMVFETVRNIKQGEELCDNYIPILRCRSDRIRKLKSQYGFLCNCVRCSGKRDRDFGEARRIDNICVQT